MSAARVTQADQYAFAMAAGLFAYAPLGRGPQAFDCWGLVLEGYREFGLPVPVDPMRAAADPRGVAEIVAEARRAGDWRPAAVGAEICAVFFPAFDGAVHAGLGLMAGVLDISARQGVRFRGWPELGDKWEAWAWVA